MMYEPPYIDVVELRKLGTEFALRKWRTIEEKKNLPEIFSIEANPGLVRGCPALLKFCRGIQKLNLRQMDNNFAFGWHGTNSTEKIANICHYGFRTNHRRRQLMGRGEYCGENPEESFDYVGTTNRLIIVVTIKDRHLISFADIQLLDNPIDDDISLSFPLLVITYARYSVDPVPWILEPVQIIPKPFYMPEPPENSCGISCWPWCDDVGILQIRSADVNQSLMHNCQCYQRALADYRNNLTADGEPPKILRTHTTKIGRMYLKRELCNESDRSVRRRVRFYKRTNSATVPGAVDCDRKVVWFLDKHGVITEYEGWLNDAIERYYVNYTERNGPYKITTYDVSKQGGVIMHSFDFISMTTTYGAIVHTYDVDKSDFEWPEVLLMHQHNANGPHVPPVDKLNGNDPQEPPMGQATGNTPQVSPIVQMDVNALQALPVAQPVNSDPHAVVVLGEPVLNCSQASLLGLPNVNGPSNDRPIERRRNKLCCIIF